MADRELRAELTQLSQTLASIETVLNVEALAVKIKELEAAAGAPDLWDDVAKAQKVTSELSYAQRELEQLRGLRSRIDDLEILLDMALSDEDAVAVKDCESELDRLIPLIDELEIRTLLNGEYDARQA